MDTYRIISSRTGNEVILDSSEMEWIFNSLSGWRDHMLEEAQKRAESGEATEHNLGDEVPVEDRSISIHAMYRDGYEQIIVVREKLIEMAGYDLTDG